MEFNVVLVRPRVPGNVGAVARAMSAMDMTRLVLVDPQTEVSEEAYVRARHGTFILEQRTVLPTLQEALKEVPYSLALSRRTHRLRKRSMTPKEAAAQLASLNPERVALVFGPENHGLERDEALQCHAQVAIPAHPERGSLNLAQAVLIVAYECYAAALPSLERTPLEIEQRASGAELSALFGKVRDALDRASYPKHGDPLDHEMRKIESILHRAQLEKWEVNFLAGLVRFLTTKG